MPAKTMKKRHNGDMLIETLGLDGKRVADVGCGNGSLARLMVRHGAEVIGVECNPVQLEKAFAEPPAGGETYVSGRAEDLPLEDGSMDIVVFFNSLHHVAVDRQAAAITEAARALKTGGLLYAAEPLAEGPHFELMKPVHDETVVRARALEAIRNAA
ncbi:MAG TPA: class I SAM-dependent methyltransferase, partial [Rhodospirillales bacterium]|nr:class I SAM-dependent methyltransferase [Rhodospirillales bacterium]